jgi:glycosyltransferase involved in cell wall biosynthesis
VLCLVGRFNLIKGHAAMIRMHRDIARRHQRCRLLLIGDGPERLGCERIVDELGLRSSVLFLGQRSDVSRWLAASDVVVVPSASEGLCRVVVEANLCGRPVVAFDCGGVAEALADPVCGDLVPRGDRQGFIDAVDRRLRTDDRPDAIALRRRAAAERFGLRRHAMALRNCYESLACSDELAHGR